MLIYVGNGILRKLDIFVKDNEVQIPSYLLQAYKYSNAYAVY